VKKTTGPQQTVFVYDARGKLIAEYSSEPSTSIGTNFITKYNFREALIRATQVNPGKVAQAHHVFPQQFEGVFERLGLNIHAPEFLQWWETIAHLKNAHAYNAE